MIELKKRIHLFLGDYILKQSKADINSFFFKVLKILFCQSLKKEGYLLSVKIDLTNRCNLKCKFCYSPKNQKQLKLKYILRLINSLDYCKINLMGGEPLLRKDLFQILKIIQKKKLQCSLFTNGTLISQEVALNLKRCKLDRVIITLFSDCKTDHDKQTQSEGSWEKTVQGIKNLIKVGIKTYTHTVITTQNIKRIKKISNFVKSLGASPLFFRYVPQNKKDPLLINDLKRLYKIKRWILFKKSKKHGEFIKRIAYLTGRNCLGGYYMLSIKSNGNVTPCPFINDIILGNIKKQNIQKIFKERFSNKEFCKFFYPPNECKTCSFLELCKGGCKAPNKILFGSYHKKDHQCQGPWRIKPKKDNICEYLPFWW